jgi:ribosomal protein S18 acetylase RimI-like enzyme
MTTIRTLTENDPIHDLASLSRQFFQEYQAFHPDFFKISSLTSDHIQAYFSRFYKNPDAAAYIAVEEGKIIGYITSYLSDQTDHWAVKRIGVISGLMVADLYRRRKIATRLFERAKSFFYQNGVTYFSVYTSVNNLGALSFYQSLGLEPLQIKLLGKVNHIAER